MSYVLYSTTTSYGTNATASAADNVIFVFRVYERLPPPPPPPAPRPTVDPWRVLGLPQGASPTDVRRAYRALARAYHPDLGPPEERDARTRRMALINGAYDVLVRSAQP